MFSDFFITKKTKNSKEIVIKCEKDNFSSFEKEIGFLGKEKDFFITKDKIFLGISIDKLNSKYHWAKIISKIPSGEYYCNAFYCDDKNFELVIEKNRKNFIFAWGLCSYNYDKYKKDKSLKRSLVVDVDKDKEVLSFCDSTNLVRDLINAPANYLTPNNLAKEAIDIFKRHKGNGKIYTNVKDQFPLLYHVGKASESCPCLVDCIWNNSSSNKIVLIGKGVTFDSGGLDLKPPAAMFPMKKDMGGAANVLGLANLIMSNNLDICLRVIIPCAENSVSSNSFRPSDILQSRKGDTVEIGNTDAEGRLVLADALTYAQDNANDIIIDMATLTGAQRIALGTEIPAFFTNDDAIGKELLDVSIASDDFVWRMPLYKSYRNLLKSSCADISSTGTTPLGGAITASLFLENFVNEDQKWIHFDLNAANNTSSPGKPKGGEAQGILSIYNFLKKTYN